ncbi:MAG TPA: ubiquinol-cytochrome c reductase cytochrome b subunit [Mycetocola sp.]|uniref:cytochrome bc1 complex cytochrome b subunit n=1 Tax=Mycetocola sp. TaxID=1871042 RepID=UPI002627AD51|nr:ubiquinol-cytochrome c reductase cytochrome b subunit [Mycetocola sp.]MCU1560692.1 ubiquinol-cytochrome c reductase cytochrome b subunit [Mycetocola sp.]HEV7848338.1 ubiquinol-cytochrome c reductase cytochrome b subunit [Mycetocola sp.]
MNTVTAPAEPKPAVPVKKSGGFTAAASNYIDERTSISTAVKELGRKIFPDHWSFLLGEVALYSFVIILLSGTFLTFFFQASMAEVHYEGSYVPLKGIEMSAAMASTMDISFDVRGGLLMRQVHHWAALLFVASIGLHMLRIFFTGAFRKPRELNWVIGFILFILAMAEGFTGYSLPDDLLSGNGLRIIDGMVKGIPLIGTWTSFLLFGGEFPGTDIVGRLYSLHILLLPAIILVLIALHLLFVVVHKHTQYSGPGRTQQNVVGYPVLPVYAAKAGGFFFIVFGVVMVIASLFSINPIWNYGPYDPSPVSAGTQPDWYIGFADGILRLAPPHLDVVLFDHTFSFGILIPLGLVGLFIMLVLFYPFIEAWITGDKREHHILDRPRNAATRTAIGAAGVTFYAVLWAAASSDLIATHFKLTMEGVIHTLQVMLFAGPVIAYFIAKRTCLALQKKDRSIALHGYESGRIVRLPGGEYIEVHEPVDDFERWKLVSHESYQPLMIRPDSRGRITVAQRVRAGLSRWFFEDRIDPITRAELESSHSNHH